MAKFLDQGGTSYLVQSLISKTKTLNGQNIWNLDPNSQLHNPGNLNTSQLAIFPLPGAFIPYMESQHEQLELRFKAWVNQKSMFQIDTPTTFPNTNLGSLRYLIIRYLADTSSTQYSPNYVMFAFQLLEQGASLTGTATQFIYKYLLVDKIFPRDNSIVLSGRITDLATSTTSDVTTSGRFYVVLETSGSGSSYTCTGATWQYVKDNVYEAFSTHNYELDASALQSTSISNPYLSLNLEHPFNSVHITLPAVSTSILSDVYLLNLCVSNDSLANIKVLIEFISGRYAGPSDISHKIFSFSTNTALRKPIRFSAGNVKNSADPNTVIVPNSAASYDVSASNQSLQRSMYEHVDINYPQAGQRFLIDAYQTSNTWYAANVIPLNSRLALSSSVTITS